VLTGSVLPGSTLSDLRWFETVIVLLLLSVAIRSLVGQSLVLPWKADPTLLFALTLAVVLGKALGGILADRYGWAAVAVSGLAASAPLLAFFAQVPALAITGTFLFNLSMPVTLACLAGMLPGKSGFAFGLTALALIIGALPALVLLQAWTGAPGFIFISILVSIAALYFGLQLYNRHFVHRLPAFRHGAPIGEK
jgi:FSR family fosmidomycin resistance protein-like MFS transporter